MDDSGGSSRPRRHPQDPQGSAAQRFRAWLKRDPQRRRRIFAARFERDEGDTHGWELLVLGLYLAGFVLWGFRRLCSWG